MAGRGCTITVKFLGGTSSHGQVEDISLPVALHSPLIVLKDQLHSLVSISPSDQVLILCDLTDPERNSDVLLIGRDNLSLKDCGIRHGSILTLHALGMSAEKQQKMMNSAFEAKVSDEEDSLIPVHSLETAVSAADANHSYNGVIFDVESCGPFEVDLVSLSVAGMLGRVRIFARERRWEDERPQRQSNHWWAHQDSVSTEGWELIADVTCRPSWDKPLEIKFDKKVKLLPHQRRALYCHSSLPDDLGIQYQSYRKSDIVAQDQFISVYPGLGHTGSEPFDDHQGWYRSYRGPAGIVKYHAKWKGWSPFEHRIFPIPLKSAVLAMLLCHNRRFEDTPLLMESMPLASAESSNAITTPRPSLTLSSLPRDIIYNILQFMHFDWFIDCVVEDNDEHAEGIDDTVARESKRNAASRFLRAVSGHLGGAANLGHLFSYLSQNTIEFEGENLALADLLEVLNTSNNANDDEDEDSDYEAYGNGDFSWEEAEVDEEEEEEEDDEEVDEDEDDESLDEEVEEEDYEHSSEEDYQNGIFGRSYFPTSNDGDSESSQLQSSSDGEMISANFKGIDDEYDDVDD